MADRIPKTLAELSKILGTASNPSIESLANFFSRASEKRIDEVLKKLNQAFKTEEERLEVYKLIYDTLGDQLDRESKIGKLLIKEVETLREVEKQQAKIKEQAQKYGDIMQQVADKTLSKILEQNKEIFQTAKDMQLAGNLTWKQYSQAYNEAFEATRRINREVGQSIANAKEMVETQNALLTRGGFRGINIGDLTNLSGSVLMMTRALGDFPNELFISLQQGYRQFGAQTDQFVTQLGNQINAFSNTFGVQIEMLSQTVSFMVQENAFLYRNNMQAQARANQNLIRAAALSGQMGISSAAFISDLASTSQFGTMAEMAEIYQGGALLQGFDTSQFQRLMQGGDAATATEMLLSSIGQTINAIDDQYLRAEYMQRIGGSFGLSRDDILMIAANSENLGQYSEELAEKVANVDNSMLDELSDLKMSVSDRLDNWWVNTKTSENLGKVLQDAGLVGIRGQLSYISGLLTAITSRSLTGGGLGRFIGGQISGLGGGGTQGAMTLANAPWIQGGSAAQMAFRSMSGMQRFGLGAAGVAGGVGLNVLGRNIQTNTNFSDAGANIGGGAVNILGGAAGGAATGFAIGGPIAAGIGAGIGAIGGLINTIDAAAERRSAMEQMEDQRRAAARSRQQQVLTGDPVVDAINNMNSNLTNVLNDNFQESIQMSFVLDTANRTDAGR